MDKIISIIINKSIDNFRKIEDKYLVWYRRENERNHPI